MKKIVIPDKTFNLYKEGLRTFVHIPRDETSQELKLSLKFGDKVNLINKVTNEEIEQTFWHAFSFKECDRFLILVFRWEAKDSLFYERRRRARSLLGSNKISTTEYLPWLSDDQMYSRNMLGSYSALFFVNLRVGLPGSTFCFVDKNEQKSEYYVVLNTLGLKTQKGSIFEVYSLFPLNLLHI
ncbi:MAG: hypothetical protein KBB91_02195 [Candidatus Pacebacteria bacterium]|nr:hypothetical protein [Candidatus Paceibacterota bacterium]MBP9701031.1 hypothetical protein [Candidatus Paceibacterota bacterium]